MPHYHNDVLSLVSSAWWHNGCDTQATYGSVIALTDLAAYQRYAIQASATNYYMDQWHDEPVRGQVFVFRTLHGSELSWHFDSDRARHNNVYMYFEINYEQYVRVLRVLKYKYSTFNTQYIRLLRAKQQIQVHAYNTNKPQRKQIEKQPKANSDYSYINTGITFDWYIEHSLYSQSYTTYNALLYHVMMRETVCCIIRKRQYEILFMIHQDVKSCPNTPLKQDWLLMNDYS